MSILQNQTSALKKVFYVVGFFLIWITFLYPRYGPWSSNHDHEFFLWFLSVSYCTHSPFNLPHTLPHSTPTEVLPYQNFLSTHLWFLRLFSLVCSGRNGKDSRMKWLMGGVQGINAKSSIFHPYWGFCNLKISKSCMAYLLPGLPS